MDVLLFEKCIRYISNNFETVLIEEIVASGNDISPNENYATIMFDDGYKDNIEYALPVLEKYQVRASFYVVTHCIDKNIPTWTYILEHSFSHTGHQRLTLPAFLPEEFQSGHFPERQDKVNFVARLKPFLKTISHSKRQEVLSAVSESFDDVEDPKIMMNWRDLRDLRDRGHYIGSHTTNHNMLGTMDDEDEIRSELRDSGKKIESELGYFPASISYPVGSFDERTKRLSEEEGYKIGLAVKQMKFNPQLDDLYEIPRIELYNEPWIKTRLRITGTLERIKKIIRY